MEGYNLMELGQFITKRRKELGKRQADLADEHISVAYISNMENGRFNQPKENWLTYIKIKPNH